MERMLVVAWAAALVPIMVWVAVEEERQWQNFAERNDCKIIEHVKARNATAYVFGKAGSQVWIQEPSRTVFECKDGVRYTR